ncbi:hypothetical protein SAMN06297164_0212 [Nitrosomonas ureae]|uniref:Uncharacterized protein n=1 Tax=Nitrosomonas ureae TaxID=44577 RepID=A0A286A2D5_9PROT|nr:hypothetical protein SAMN06297164_0212 [Nitrosomonas ureae]
MIQKRNANDGTVLVTRLIILTHPGHQLSQPINALEKLLLLLPTIVYLIFIFCNRLVYNAGILIRFIHAKAITLNCMLKPLFFR